MKIFLILTLFSSMAFAEGDIGTGGKTCPQGQTCFTGDIGTGGKTCPQGQTCLVSGDASKDSADEDSANSVLEFVLDYLISIF